MIRCAAGSAAPAPWRAASTSRVTARLRRTRRVAADAGAIATAATPAGTLAGQEQQPLAGSSAPWRL